MRRRHIAALVLALALLAAPAVGCAKRSAVPGEAIEGASNALDATPAVTDGSAAAVRSEQPSQPPNPIRAVAIAHGPRGTMKIALTFDLCETPGSTTGWSQRIFDTLTNRQAAATFFMGGHWAQSHPSAAREIAKVPYFEIGNHTYAHMNATKITSAEFRDEVERAQSVIQDLTGRRPVLFRFPYGVSDARTRLIVADEGLQAVQYSVVPGDPDPNVSGDMIVQTILKEARSGDIVVLHANNRGVHTAAAMPWVIDELRAKGYQLVTVSELLSGDQGD